MEAGDNLKVLASIIVLLMEMTVGVFLNVFIVAIVFYDFYKQKNMSNSNKILAGLGLSNVMYNVMISAGLLDEVIGLRGSSTVVLSSIYNLLLLCSICSCAWFTAGLGTFYFIKISQSRLLSWVKVHLRSIVSWMLLVLVVVSFINSSFGSLLISPRIWRNITDTPPSVLRVLADNRSKLLNAVLTVTSIPFTIVLTSSVCSIWTLNRHSHKMRRSMATEDTPHLVSYMRVVYRMTQSLIFYGLLYILMLVFHFSITTHVETGFWISLALMSSFTPVQSLLLILSNPRLTDAWKEMLPRHSCTRCVLVWT